MALEQRGSVILLNLEINHCMAVCCSRWEEFLETTKSFKISKHDVVCAWQLVKANKGGHGVDGETIEEFESDLKANLYKIWNRMSSGSYFPPPVKTVAIPKKTGGERKLGIPTVSDRVAQMVVKLHFEPLVEPWGSIKTHPVTDQTNRHIRHWLSPVNGAGVMTGCWNLISRDCSTTSTTNC